MAANTIRAGMFLLLLATVVTGAAGDHAFAPRGHAAEPVTVEVTSAGDGADAACPHATKCTLRRAIETINAGSEGTSFVVTFSVTVFPAETPATIAMAEGALPAVTKANVTIDARERGVRLDGAALPAAGTPDGLVLEGANSTVTGLAIHNFAGRCLVLAGASSRAGGNLPGDGNRIGGCGTGIVLAGANSKAEGNRVGFAAAANGEASAGTGVLVTAAGAVVGGPTGAHGNVIGHAGTAIQVGSGSGAAFSGVLVTRNIIGNDPAGGSAPVGTGVNLRQPSSGTLVQDNLTTNAQTGISVAATTAGQDVTGNTFTNNHFAALVGMAIDLNADSLRNANDEGDTDTGPNNLLNHPVITKATQAQVSGTAGPTCPGCSVTLYLAAHTPGSANDYGTMPIAGATATTDGAGSFQFDGLPLAPGQWVIAIATDGDGNTSEFGPAARVGAGVVQCANPALLPGWNHAGYFGSGTYTLGDTYPAGTNKVASIHRLSDGTANFESWYANTLAGRTLFTLAPGEAYWFYATSTVAGSGGFTLTVPVPVALKAGWNEFVYIGATVDVRDALASAAGKYSAVYLFENDGSAARWLAWGNAETPDYVRAFTAMEACGVYSVLVTEDVTLTPLHP